MSFMEREDLWLLLLRDANEEQNMWMDRWAVSYPQVKSVTIHANDDASQWQQSLQQVLNQLADSPVFIVAHGKACAAFCSWLFYSDVLVQKRTKGVMLVAPIYQDWQQEHAHILNRAHCNFPTAVVVGAEDTCCNWSQAVDIATKLGGRAIKTPHHGHLNQSLAGWQWGMKLMQQMILA